MDLRYMAAMVLSGVGDALGYRGGSWEFCYQGEAILKDLKKLGGLTKLEINKKDWPVSDDTVLHLANAEALAEKATSPLDTEELYAEIARNYIKTCMQDMAGRAPGRTTMASCHLLKPHLTKGYRIPFNPRGGGCGASMRSMCIGLRYPDYTQKDCLSKLISISIESGRMTHHHPTGYLGAFASALFTALAIKSVPPEQWGSILMALLPQAMQYVYDEEWYVNDNKSNTEYFESKWKYYLSARCIIDGKSKPKFPAKYGANERDAFYKSLSASGWGGASGHDSVMIAYDAFLAHNGSWETLCKHGMFHGGDSDSTGVMAACWYGATHGYNGVPEKNFKGLEYRERLEEAGKKLYHLAVQDSFL